jgi:uncharacterized membrane protein SpoIIM required for sporulation
MQDGTPDFSLLPHGLVRLTALCIMAVSGT